MVKYSILLVHYSVNSFQLLNLISYTSFSMLLIGFSFMLLFFFYFGHRNAQMGWIHIHIMNVVLAAPKRKREIIHYEEKEGEKKKQKRLARQQLMLFLMDCDKSENWNEHKKHNLHCMGATNSIKYLNYSWN